MSAILVEREEAIAVVLLNRPEAMNALNDEMMTELVEVLVALDDDEEVRCIVLGGSDRAFAAGADIGEMAEASAMDMYEARRIDRWDAIRKVRTPLVAAVSGDRQVNAQREQDDGCGKYVRPVVPPQRMPSVGEASERPP